jgi:hypothetical protein
LQPAVVIWACVPAFTDQSITAWAIAEPAVQV